MLQDFQSRQFLKFIFAGGFAALVNFSSRFLYSLYFSYGSSIILAYLTGMVTAFLLTKAFVFEKSAHSTWKEFYFFTLVNLLAITQTYIISIGLAKYIFIKIHFDFYPEAVAHAIGVIFPVFTSFIGHKYISFSKTAR